MWRIFFALFTKLTSGQLRLTECGCNSIEHSGTVAARVEVT